MAEVEKHWYVVRAISGKEKKVKEYCSEILRIKAIGGGAGVIFACDIQIKVPIDGGVNAF